MIGEYLRLTLDALVNHVKEAANPQTGSPERVLDTTISVDRRFCLGVAACVVPECP